MKVAMACVLVALTLLAITVVAQDGSGVAPLPSAVSYEPITGEQRFTWFVRGTIGPTDLVGGLFIAGFGTATDMPKEYHGTWAGYGKRYGMRLTGISTGNAMEAGLGSLWGEDPRYFRVGDGGFGARLRNVIGKTFVAPRRDGHYAPAYARYMAIAGNNFLSNTWRADSEANTSHALTRSLYGVLGRMGGNACDEFCPDLRQLIFRRNKNH